MSIKRGALIAASAVIVGIVGTACGGDHSSGDGGPKRDAAQCKAALTAQFQAKMVTSEWPPSCQGLGGETVNRLWGEVWTDYVASLSPNGVAPTPRGPGYGSAEECNAEADRARANGDPPWEVEGGLQYCLGYPDDAADGGYGE
jgi:hypothetical protein